MRKVFIVNLFVATLVFAQEPSAFNVGGVAPQKNEIDLINENLFKLSTQIKNIEQTQEGLQSIFDGQIRKIQENSGKIDILKGESNSTIFEVRKYAEVNFALQNENIEKIKNSITELGALITKTNAQIQSEIDTLKEQVSNIKATKDNSNNREKDSKEIDKNKEKSKESKQESKEESKRELNNDSKEFSASKKEKNIESKQDKKMEFKGDSIKKTLEGKELFAVFNEAQEFFNNKDYDKAKVYLEYTVEKKHKPARGNYLLGEIAYQQKRYEDAIYYYKVSATLYDKADYMPNLLLNSANSFLALKDRENANRFLEALVALYPNSSATKKAKKLLK